MLIPTLVRAGGDPFKAVQIQLFLKRLVLGLGKVSWHDVLYKVINVMYLKAISRW